MSEIKEAIRERFEPDPVNQLFMMAINQTVMEKVPDASREEVSRAVDEMVADGELVYVDDDEQVVRWND